MYQATLQDLMAEQIAQRCLISSLYGELLRTTPPSKRIVGAAHEWSLPHIESLIHDLVVNIPNQAPTKNVYSKDILLAGADTGQLTSLVAALVEALHQHSQLSTRIEQFGKGVA